MSILDKVILGINDTHDASAAIVRNGKILCAISEERVQRIKSTGGFPAGAIKACLDFAGLEKSDIDYVALAGTRAVAVNMLSTLATFGVKDWIKIQDEIRHPRFYEDRNVSIGGVFPDYEPEGEIFYDRSKIPLKETWELTDKEREEVAEYRLQFVSEFCGVPRDRIFTVDHHTSHAYYAYYASPFRDEAVTTLTLDAGGDGVYDSANVFDAEGKFSRLHGSHDCIIGPLYTYITLILGMCQFEHEYKVMGLAPYAKEHVKREAREKLLKFMELDGIKFSVSPEVKDLYFYTKDLLKNDRFDGIAGAAQDFAEHFITRWVTNVVAETGSSKVAYGGGVSLNVKANQSITELDCVDRLFIPPGPGDESLPIGAAWRLMDILNESGDHRHAVEPIKNGFLGPGFDDHDIDQFREHPAVRDRFEEVSGDPDTLVCDALVNHEIVGLARGRMEFGPRALGNRSLIANASSQDSVRKINDAIKGRDFWMPFAPSILAEHLDDYVFDNGVADMSYMTVCANSKPKALEDIIAGTHPYDRTARVHTVHKDMAPEYHQLLTRFHARTGMGGVLNTSLNIHGKPIVWKPVDIANELLSVESIDLNNLLIGDRFFRRRS